MLGWQFPRIKACFGQPNIERCRSFSFAQKRAKCASGVKEIGAPLEPLVTSCVIPVRHHFQKAGRHLDMTIFDNDGPGGEKSGEPNAGPFPEGEGMTNLIYLAEQIRMLEVLASEAEIPHVRSYIRRVAAQFRDALDELTTVPALMDAVFPWPPKQ